MPTIFFYGPELDDTKKRKLVKEFTETVSNVSGLDKSVVTVYLRSASADNIGAGGEILSDVLARHNG